MILFLRLLIAHLIADFLLQPNSWVEHKNKNGVKSRKLFYHILVVTSISVLFSLDYFAWQIPLFIFTIHYLIDLAKIYIKPSKAGSLTWFLGDQILHVLSIAGVVFIINGVPSNIASQFSDLISNERNLIVGLAYIFVIWPSMIIINLATKHWQNQIHQTMGPSLQNAGKWIGVLERILVLTFVLGAQFQAIGFLIAAKSILRISVKNEDGTRLLSEYVLVGTFISFTIAIMTGLLANSML
ncbi:DUF3307 domain-containing protein [uncultured Sunxiuqinia sp.]|uniref:DUF3307 domain-containing protein n=1 Tax=uncultured Sunxiuqinia sp. TaxID=1573825 RepID=UPI002AA69729|nr:DUF3307 domain-containing protein [uncultured Sunxiuqinia sp.]